MNQNDQEIAQSVGNLFQEVFRGPNREEVNLGSSVDKVLNERGRKYGKFETHAHITQRIKSVMRETANWHKLTADQKEALEMVAHKIGRILNGDPDYDDSWVDIAGYTKLVADRLQGISR